MACAGERVCMFGNLVAAFGLTVLCLAPILLVALIFPPVLMRLNRPRSKDGEKAERGVVGAALAFARFYLLSLVVLVMATVVFWWAFLLLTGAENVIDFAAQSLPIEREAVEEAIEPALTLEAGQGGG